MKDLWLISIVLTLYNKAPYIEETIYSIYNQTYKNWELIIMDDCSNDWSFEIAKRFCDKLWITEKCTFVRNKENLRVAKNFEKWLTFAKWNWVAMCDWDDILVRNKLELNIEFCVNEKKDICYSDYIEIDENNTFLNKPKLYLSDKIVLTNPDYKIRILINQLVWSGIFFNKKIKDELINYKFPDKVYQDYWVASYAALFFKVWYIKKPLFFYRRCDHCITDPKNFSILGMYEKVIWMRILASDHILNNIHIKRDINKFLSNLKKIDTKLLDILSTNKIFLKSIKLFFTILFSKLWLKSTFILLIELLVICRIKIFKKIF